MYIDDVVIATWDPLAPDDYDYFQGTSMAAPHVSGLAGLIMARFPTLSTAGVKDRILGGVDPKPDLVGMTVSGGRINANNSLRLPVAPSGLSARGVLANQVNLSWTDQSGPPLYSWTEEDGFTVYRKKERNGTYIPVGVAGGVPGMGTAVSFVDSSVAPGQMYFYKVAAYSVAGNSGFTNESTVITPGGVFGLTGEGGCFVATAAYGSPHGRFIDLLRVFRDEYLMAHPIGKKWVDLYYRYGPTMAGFIADHPAMRNGARLILFPFVALSAGMVHTTALQKGLIFFSIIGFLLGMAVLSKRRTFNQPFPMP